MSWNIFLGALQMTMMTRQLCIFWFSSLCTWHGSVRFLGMSDYSHAICRYYSFSFVTYFAPLFRWLWGVTMSHVLVSSLSFSQQILLLSKFLFFYFVSPKANGKLLLTCSSTWTAYRCWKNMKHMFKKEVPKNKKIVISSLHYLWVHTAATSPPFPLLCCACWCSATSRSFPTPSRCRPELAGTGLPP